MEYIEQTNLSIHTIMPMHICARLCCRHGWYDISSLSVCLFIFLSIHALQRERETSEQSCSYLQILLKNQKSFFFFNSCVPSQVITTTSKPGPCTNHYRLGVLIIFNSPELATQGNHIDCKGWIDEFQWNKMIIWYCKIAQKHKYINMIRVTIHTIYMHMDGCRCVYI